MMKELQSSSSYWQLSWLVFLILGTLLALSGLIFSASVFMRGGTLLIVVALLLGLFNPKLSGYRFTYWILIANFLAMLYPQYFLELRGFSLTNPWLMLIVVQLIMFGMGTQMSFRDFAHVISMPRGVLVGTMCQFTIMPLLGYSLAKLFQFPAEIGAGVVLIGCCSSGLASNVMTYLARGNLPLSITLTAVATALAPLITPIWFKILAGRMVEVDVVKMSLDIVKMVIVPIFAAFMHDWLSSSQGTARRCLHGLAALGALWLLFLLVGGWNWLSEWSSAQPWLLPYLGLLGFVSAAVLFGACYHYLIGWLPRLDRWMPVLSMAGIVYFTLVTTAKGRDQLLAVGFLLLMATVLHNLLGYCIGYYASRLIGMNCRDARTVAIEVGAQNGSMAISLAQSMNKLQTVGLAAVIFAPLMNVTGSILANYWRKRKCADSAST